MFWQQFRNLSTVSAVVVSHANIFERGDTKSTFTVGKESLEVNQWAINNIRN